LNPCNGKSIGPPGLSPDPDTSVQNPFAERRPPSPHPKGCDGRTAPPVAGRQQCAPASMRQAFSRARRTFRCCEAQLKIWIKLWGVALDPKVASATTSLRQELCQRLTRLRGSTRKWLPHRRLEYIVFDSSVGIAYALSR
jgi:hypothetical protein